MANITLPSNPVNGQKVTIGTRLFEYNSTSGRWSSRVFQPLGDTSVTVTNQAPTINVSSSSISLDTAGANVLFTYQVADVDSSALKVSHTVNGVTNSTYATVYHHKANNTVTIQAGTEAFSSANVVLTVTDGRNNASVSIDVSAEYLDKLADPTSPSVFASITRGAMNNYIEDIAYNNSTEDASTYGHVYAVNDQGNRIERIRYNKAGSFTFQTSTTTYSSVFSVWYDPNIDHVVVTSTNGNTRFLNPTTLAQTGSISSSNYNNAIWVPVNSSYGWLVGPTNWYIIDVSTVSSPSQTRAEAYSSWRRGYYYRAQEISGGTTLQGFFGITGNGQVTSMNVSNVTNVSRSLNHAMQNTSGTTLQNLSRCEGYTGTSTDWLMVYDNTGDAQGLYFYDCAEDSGNATYPIQNSTTWVADYQLVLGTGDRIEGMAVKDGYLYLRLPPDEIAVYDVRDPSSISKVGSLSTAADDGSDGYSPSESTENMLFDKGSLIYTSYSATYDTRLFAVR